MPVTVLLTAQIGHYHDARYRAAAAALGNLSVISIAGEGPFPEFLARGAPAYPVVCLFESQGKYAAEVKSGSMIAKLAQTLDRLNPRVIVIAGWYGSESFAALLWARSQGVPVVVMSESQAFDAPRKPLTEWIKRRVVRLCDSAFVGGSTHKDYMCQLGMAAERVHLGYNAVDNDYFSAGADAARAKSILRRTELALPTRYIIASARFVAKKNLPALVRAFGLAASRHQNAPDLVLLGDGEERPAIERAIAALSAGRVHLLGFQRYEVLPALYGLSEGFIHASLTEQWGLVVNEAMASAVPVIVSRTCGAASLIENGRTGFLVDPNRDDDIADAIERLFTLGKSEAGRMGQAARESISHWGPRRFAAGLSAAVAQASLHPRAAPLRPWDVLLLRRLANQIIDYVS